jgi:hypothetical protein
MSKQSIPHEADVSAAEAEAKLREEKVKGCAQGLLEANSPTLNGVALPIVPIEEREALKCAIVDLFWESSKRLMRCKEQDAALNEILRQQDFVTKMVAQMEEW